MKINETKTYELSMEDIKTAIINELCENYGVKADLDNVKLNVKEIKETYSIGIYDSDTRVIGYDITAKVEV